MYRRFINTVEGEPRLYDGKFPPNVVTEYTGKNCEMKLHHCVTSPCENDALCLMEDGVRVCYCVPDYHGDRCQFQYDECQLGPR
jgi:hypothetical protein